MNDLFDNLDDHEEIDPEIQNIIDAEQSLTEMSNNAVLAVYGEWKK